MEATEEGVTGGERTLADRDISLTLHLADLFAELLPVNGASIVVRSGPDNTQLVHATDDVVAQLDDLQFTLGEGPCLDAFRLRQPVLVPDLGRRGGLRPVAGVHPRGATPVPLFGRAEIPQATGMIAVQLGVSITEALAQLRAAAFAAHRPILDIAEDVIARRLVFSNDRR